MPEDKKKLSFDDILKNDPLGLIGEVKPKTSSARTEDERLIASFEEINDFFDKNGREPQKGNIQESSLFFRLKGIRSQPVKIKSLKKYDRFDLLEEDSAVELGELQMAAEPPSPPIEKPEIPEINSIDDILNNDVLGLLGNEDEAQSIFNLKHVKRAEERAQADFIAQRKPCKNFEKYEPMFVKCQEELKTGKRKLIKFNENQIQEGAFFVMKGVLCYVEKFKNVVRRDNDYRLDGRTRTIFENGTESNILFQSLARALFEDGMGVTLLAEEIESRLFENANAITKEDTEKGFIYVLQSKSKDPRIAGIRDLYKIGYSSTPVEDRIKNSEKEPTYLMAPVHIVSTYKVFNVEPQKFESLLHRFFSNVCLDINLYDSNDQLYRPREWFVAPFEVIEQAIDFILSGEIVKYRYDVEARRIMVK